MNKNCKVQSTISKYIYDLYMRASIYVLCLSVCPSVRLYTISVKTAKSIGLIFCVWPQMTPGKVYGCSKLQKFAPKVVNFCKILKMREKVLLNPWTLFLSFHIVQRKDAFW